MVCPSVRYRSLGGWVDRFGLDTYLFSNTHRSVTCSVEHVTGFKRSHRRQDTTGIELYQNFIHRMDCSSEAYTVVVSVMYCIEELHEDVAKNVELLEALLIDSQRLDKVAAAATFLVILVNLPRHPVVRWEFVVDAVDDVGEVGEAQLVSLLAADRVAVLRLEDVKVALGEGREGRSGVRAHQAVGAWARAIAG